MEGIDWNETYQREIKVVKGEDEAIALRHGVGKS